MVSGRNALPAAFAALLFLAGCTTEQALAPASPGVILPTPPPATGGTAAAPSTSSATPPAATAPAASTPSAPPASPATLPPAVAGAQRIQLAPIVGATVETVTPLSRRLAARAKERGITLVGTGGGAATLVAKGYFSALSEGRRTTVIYVWDILDPAGNRLHRIQGQKVAPAATGQGFAAVDDATMEAIADDTIDQLLAWLSSRRA